MKLQKIADLIWEASRPECHHARFEEIRQLLTAEVVPAPHPFHRPYSELISYHIYWHDCIREKRHSLIHSFPIIAELCGNRKNEKSVRLPLTLECFEIFEKLLERAKAAE